MIDIDFFKQINDTYGHTVGDIVLRELAETLKKSIRSTDIIARVGEEGFCVLLFNCNKEQSFEIGKAINREIKFATGISASLKQGLSIIIIRLK